MLLSVIFSIQLCFYLLSQSSVLLFCFGLFFFLASFLALVIVGGFAFWFGCSLLFFYYLKIIFKYFFIFITLFYFIFLFLSFFLPFILSRVDDRLLVLQPSTRTVHLRWESQVQDTGPQETSQLQVISNGENLPDIPTSTPRPSSTQ